MNADYSDVGKNAEKLRMVRYGWLAANMST